MCGVWWGWGTRRRAYKGTGGVPLHLHSHIALRIQSYPFSDHEQVFLRVFLLELPGHSVTKRD